MRKVTYTIDEAKYLSHIYDVSAKKIRVAFPDSVCAKFILQGEGEYINSAKLLDGNGNKLPYDSLTQQERQTILKNCILHFEGDIESIYGVTDILDEISD